MESVLCSWHVIIQKGFPWLNVPYVERKLALLRRLGRWLADLTKAARRRSSRSDSLNTAESLSGQLWARERSRLANKIISLFSLFSLSMLEVLLMFGVH